MAVGAGATPYNRPSTTRDQWIAAAQDTLIHAGVEAIRPETLAGALSSDPNDFFQHFPDVHAVRSALIERWEQISLTPLEAIDARADADPFAQFETFMATWVDSEPHFPVYDSAIRHWAQIDDDVAARVGKLDDRRIARLAEIFRALGHEQEEAFIRARITYFHQIGYYAMGVKESSERRRQYWPLYVWILTGR
jgi:AcrR family transcriptional regulator